MALPRNDFIFNDSGGYDSRYLVWGVVSAQGNDLGDKSDLQKQFSFNQQTIEVASGDDGDSDDGFFSSLIDKVVNVYNVVVDISQTIADYSIFFNSNSDLKKEIKDQSTKIVNAVNNPSFLNYGGYFYVQDPTGTSDNAYDGFFVRMIKSQTRAIVSAVNNNTSDLNNLFGTTGTFTNSLKSEVNRIISAVNNPSFLSSGGYFYVQDSTGTSNNSSDGHFVRMIKTQTRAIVSAVNNPSFLSSDGYFYVQDPTGTSNNAYDGHFVRMIKSQTRAIINAIGGGVGGGGDSGELLDALEDIENAIKSINSTPAGATIWDFLTSLVDGLTSVLNGILDFLNNLLDFLTAALIPEDTEFITDWFNNITDEIDNKFNVVGQITTTLKTSFEVEEREFTDKYVDINIFGSVNEIKLLDAEYLNIAIPYVRKFLSAIMILITMIYAVRKITGNGGIVE